MKKIIVIIAILNILICKSYGQNSPFSIYGGGLDGSIYQQSAIYSDALNGLLIEGPIDPNNNKLPVSFSWRGGGIPSLFINGDSKIGIGTATPEVKLDVFSSNVAAFFRSTTNTVPISIINSGSSISTVGFKGSTSASEYNVRVGADGNDFIAYTNNIERMRITSNGNVGIGTNNPVVKLEVVDGVSWFGRPSNKVDNHNATEFGNTVEFNNSFVSGQAGYVSAYFPTHNNFLFGADYDGHLGGTPPNIQFGRISNPYLHIQNSGSTSGNVGIGTTNPKSKLEINTNSAGSFSNNYLRLNASTNGAYGGANHIEGSYTDDGNVAFPNIVAKITMASDVVSATDVGGVLSFYTKEKGGTYSSNPLERMRINSNGNVGIGTTNPTSKLTVGGNISSREVKVTVDAGADFVFEKEYHLPSLESVDKFIKENKHLPEIASAKEMKANGINLSEMNIKLLQKMEEMTLYMIEQEKKNNAQSKEIESLKKENEFFKTLSERFSKIESQLKTIK